MPYRPFINIERILDKPKGIDYKTANFLINSVIFQRDEWDAAFKALNIGDSGFLFEHPTFGEDLFDMWTFIERDHTYQDIMGLAHYKSPGDFRLITRVDGLMDSSFIRKYEGRVKL